MRVLALALAACVAAGGALAKQPRSQKTNAENERAQSRPNGDPNGVWRIDATTTVGACQTLIPPTLEIVDKKVMASPGPALSAWGYVDEEGTLVARFTGAGDRVARLHGTLRGDRFSGAWSSSTDLCGGTWSAARSDAGGQ